MTIIPSNMIGHFLVHSSILPSRSSPSALVAEVEKAPCRPIEELLRETWKTFPLSPIDPRNDEDKMMLILTEVGVMSVFKNGRTPYTNTILNTLSQSFFLSDPSPVIGNACQQ